MQVPPLETARLTIRPFVIEDLDDIHRILDVELHNAETGDAGPQLLAGRRQWVEWSILNYEQLANLYQPPYSDRAVVLKQTGQLIGACGFVPCLAPFTQLPYFAGTPDPAPTELTTPEFGLYYALSPAHHRRGYATEAAGALIDYAFRHLHLKRVIATTAYNNAGSAGVMRKLGMRIERNPYATPPWLQIVGVLENPILTSNVPE